MKMRIRKTLKDNKNVEVPNEILELLEQRKKARESKDYALSDTLRDKIKEIGYDNELTDMDYRTCKINIDKGFIKSKKELSAPLFFYFSRKFPLRPIFSPIFTTVSKPSAVFFSMSPSIITASFFTSRTMVEPPNSNIPFSMPLRISPASSWLTILPTIIAPTSA